MLEPALAMLIACIAENKHPPLTRCWQDLEKLFMSDPAFEVPRNVSDFS